MNDNMPVTLDTETIRLVTLFENVTGAGVKDCIVDNDNGVVYFVIDEGELGRAIGKNGTAVKKTESMINKSIKVFEFSDDVEKFMKNLIPQVNSLRMRNENGRTIMEIWVDKGSKATVIGRGGRNLKVYKELLERNHRINDISVR